jgi:4-hydroxyphenylacetate 3-monooxygenase
MFYSGAPFVTRGNSFRFFDWDSVKGRVDAFLNSYGLPEDRSHLPDAAE